MLSCAVCGIPAPAEREEVRIRRHRPAPAPTDPAKVECFRALVRLFAREESPLSPHYAHALQPFPRQIGRQGPRTS